MSETGYQSGARQAAHRSNVNLTSLRDLGETCAEDLAMMRARKLFYRAENFGKRYWALDKQTRIDFGLRPDFLESDYSGDQVVQASKGVILAALFRGFPVVYSETASAFGGAKVSDRRFPGDVVIEGPSALIELVGNKLDELDQMLHAAETVRDARR